MAIKYSSALRDALEDSVIRIYTGKCPKYPNSPDLRKYTFKTSSPNALDYELIKKELTRENPLAIIHRSDGYHRAVVHNSIIQKAYMLCPTESYIDYIFEWRKTEKGNIAEIIKLIKEIKNASWPSKKETTFKVDIIKI